MGRLSSLFLIIFLGLFQLQEVYAQREKVDSLHHALEMQAEAKNEPQDTALVRLHNLLAWEYYGLSNYDTATYHVGCSFSLLEPLPKNDSIVKKLKAEALNYQGSLLTERSAYDSAIQVFQKSLALWKQLDHLPGMADVYNNMGIIYDYRGQLDKSIQNYERALELRMLVNDQVGVADAYNNLGVVYYYQGYYQRALNSYLSALERYRKAGDLDGVAYIYNNIGLVYKRQKQYDKALESYEDALEVRLELGGNLRELGSIHANIAGTYMDMGIYQEALHYNKTALDIFDQLKDQYRRASILNNLGFIYNKLGNTEKAISFAQKALLIKRKIDSRKTTIITLSLLCELMMKKENLSEAESYCTEALTLAQLVGSEKKIADAYLNMADMKEQRGETEEALQYLRSHLSLQDSLLQAEYSSKIAEMTARYQTEKKEQEIALQKSQLSEKEAFIQKQKVLIWGIGISLLLVFGLAAAAFWLYRSQYRAGQLIRRQKLEVDQKNQLLDDASNAIKLRNQELSQLNMALTKEKSKVEEANLNLELKVLKRTISLRQRNEKLKQYAFFNAHRFRGPVANILGLTHLIKSHEFMLEEKLIFVDKLSEAAQQLDLSIREIQEQLDHEEGEEDTPEEV